MTHTLHAHRVALAAALALALVAAGCGRNKPGTLLAPTGIRPGSPLTSGSVTGAVLYYDALRAPDLGTGPFPPTRVELVSGATVVAVDSLSPFAQMFLFENVRPGPYTVRVRSRVFSTVSRPGVYVRYEPVDAGNFTLALNPDSLSANLDVIGTMPGYDIDQISTGPTTCIETQRGCWVFPNDFALPPTIPAGTYRFKFVNSYASTATSLIGWGGSAAETLTVPVTDHVTRYGVGRATDLVVHFPTTAVYAFALDERRQLFSIQVAPTPALPFRRR